MSSVSDRFHTPVEANRLLSPTAVPGPARKRLFSGDGADAAPAKVAKPGQSLLQTKAGTPVTFYSEYLSRVLTRLPQYGEKRVLILTKRVETGGENWEDRPGERCTAWVSRMHSEGEESLSIVGNSQKLRNVVAF